MFNIFNLKPEVFGLDIDDSSIRIVKLIKNKNDFKLSSFHEIEIGKGIVKDGIIKNPDALSYLIKKACRNIKGKKLRTHYVVVSLPEEKSFYQTIQMPQMTKEEMKFAVPLEAENYIPFSIDKVYLDFQAIEHPNNTGPTDVLVNVMAKQVVDSYVSCIKSSGLVPYVLEVESQAIARALLKENDSEPSIIIELKESKTNLIVYFNKSIRFTSSMQISSKKFTEAISDKMGFSFRQAEKIKIRYGLEANKKYNIGKITSPILEEFLSQIKKYVDFYQTHLFNETSDKKFKKIILCGGGANLKGFAEFLSKNLKIPVMIGNPLMNLRNYDGPIIKIPSEKVLFFTTAIGLALRDND